MVVGTANRLLSLSDLRFGLNVGQPVNSDGAWVDKFYRFTLPLRLLDRQAQQI